MRARRKELWGTRTPSRSGAEALLDEFDRVTDRLDVLGNVVRNLDVELFLESHDQLDEVEAVGAEVVDEARLLADLLGVSVEVFDHDLSHALENVGHSAPSPSLWLYAWPTAPFKRPTRKVFTI